MIRIFKRIRLIPKLVSILIFKKVKINDVHYRCPASFRVAKVAAQHEKHEEEVELYFRLASKVKPQGAFLDVGANVGQTLLKVFEYFSDRQYIGFEPQTPAASMVDQLLSLNNFNGMCLPIGLSEKSGFVKLGRSKKADQSASIDSNYRPSDFHESETVIPVLTGDEVREGIGIDSVSVLKIDVEGAELEVLRGFRRTIENCRPLLVFEVLPSNYVIKTKSALPEATRIYRERKVTEMSDFLESCAMTIFVFDQVLKKVDKIKPNERSIQNVLAVPNEYAEKVTSTASELVTS